MKFYQFLSGLMKCCKGRDQFFKITSILWRCERIILILVSIAFCSGNLYAQHLFSVSYNYLSQDITKQIKKQIANSNSSFSSFSLNSKFEYSFSLASVENTKIIIFNEENGNNVVITPTESSPKQFRIQPFFIEELIRSALGNASRYFIIEAGSDFTVKNILYFLVQTEDIFIPRYFYGPKENVKEALPKDRQIINIFKEKPKIIPAFPDDPENLSYVAQLEEEMNYYVYMYLLPDKTLCIYDEHFNPSAESNTVISTRSSSLLNTINNSNSVSTSSTRALSHLQFNLTGSLTAPQITATEHALNLWSAQLGSTFPVNINVSTFYLNSSTIGRSYTQPQYWNPSTSMWYSSALGNQLAGYNIAPGMNNIVLEMNTYYTWYYGVTGNPSSSQYDWITIMLHEVNHGLGFAPLVCQDGEYRYFTSGGSSTTSFPGIFDYQLYDGTSGNNLTTFSVSERAKKVVSNDLYSGRPGSYLLSSNGGSRVKIYAPKNWANASSVAHWDDGVSFSTFMKWSINYGFRCITINSREIGIMRDMGWSVAPTISISGPASICKGSSTSFSVTNAPAGFTWSCSSNLSLSSTTNSTITVYGNSSGEGWLEIFLGSVSLKYQVVTVSGVSIVGPTNVKMNGEYYASISGCTNPNNNNFIWDVIPVTTSPGSYSTYYFGYNNCNLGVNFSQEGYYDIRSEINTSCGTQVSYLRVYAKPSKGVVSGIFYPNPVDDILYVDLDKIENIQNNTSINYDIRLYDGLGNVLRQASAKNGIVQFNVSKLIDGIYFLHINNGVSQTHDVHKVIIQH